MVSLLSPSANTTAPLSGKTVISSLELLCNFGSPAVRERVEDSKSSGRRASFKMNAKPKHR